MKILVTGSNGQLGKDITHKLKKLKYDVYEKNSKQLDITNSKSVSDAFKKIKPKVIINCAAFTNVEAAETEVEKCSQVNINGPKNLALASKKYNCLLIHFSTDYVFDGKKNLPYFEDDQTNPINFYGESKLLGEREIIKILDNYLIIRTSWVFGKYGNNFPKIMLSKSELKDLKVVSDQCGMPTSSSSIANAVIKICKKIENGKEINFGIYHYSNYPRVTWYDFAKEVFKQAIEQKIIFKIPKLIRVTSNDFITIAARPKNSELSTSKIEKEFDLTKSFWKDDIKEIF